MSTTRPHRSELTLTPTEHRAVMLAAVIAGQKPATFVRDAALHAAAALVEGVHKRNVPDSTITAPRPESPTEAFFQNEHGRAQLATMGRKSDEKSRAWVEVVLARCRAERVILQDAARRLAALDAPEAE